MAKIGGCELAGLILCLGGIVLACVAQATNKWLDSTTSYQGLWQICQIVSGSESCSSLGFDFGSQLIITVTKIVHLVGIAFCALALLVGSCGMCKEDSRNGNVSAQGGLYITAAIFIGAASGVYLLVQTFSSLTGILTSVFTGTSVTITTSGWGYSYWLSWASCGALLIGGIWLCCASCSMSKRQATIVPVAVPPQGTTTTVTTGYYA